MGGGRRTGRGGVGLGDQDGCECRSEVFVKIQKKIGEWRGRVRVNLCKELKFFVKITKNKFSGGGGGQNGGVRVDVNEVVRLLCNLKKKGWGSGRAGGGGG